MDQRSESRTDHRRVLGVCALAGFMAFLDVTIVNVAFPNMEHYFPAASRSDLSWILNGYNVMFSAMLVPAGRLADLVGRRRVFLAGLILFTVASLGCALAPNEWLLVAARVVQAVGAAAVIPTSIALLLREYPVQRRLAATSVLGACAAAAAAVGPTVGGLLVELMDWRLVFLVNLPIGVIAVLWGASVLRESAVPSRGARPDLLGAGLLAVGLGAVVLVIVEGNEWGWATTRVLATAATGLALVGAALWRSARHPAPVLDLGLLRLRPVAAGNAALVLFAIAIYGKILVDVLYLTEVWQLRPLYAGLALSPGPLITAACAPIAGRFADRYGARRIAAMGVVLYALGCVWFATVPGTQPAYLTHWLPGSLLTGVGNSMAFPILTGVAVSSLPYEKFGIGSAVNATARQIGAALGVAIVIAVLSTVTGAHGERGQAALDRGFWFTCVAAVLSLAGVLALRGGQTRVDHYPGESAQPTAVQLAPSPRF
jgi:EmrB/QacA subfamily drug resistance transporter